MIERMQEWEPETIRFNASEDDLTSRSGHLRRLLQATRDYVGFCLQDTANSTWALDIDRKYIDGCFDDLIGDVCGPITRAADTIEEERHARVA